MKIFIVFLKYWKTLSKGEVSQNLVTLTATVRNFYILLSAHPGEIFWTYALPKPCACLVP
jgi:hypothetical protein